MFNDEERVTVRLSPTDRSNLDAIARLAGAGPLARRDKAATVRHALELAAATLRTRAETTAHPA